MSFLLAAIIQIPVKFVAWAANGAFYAVMDKKGAYPSHATVLHAMALHATVLPAIAAPVGRQCVQGGGSAVKAHSSALHAKDAQIGRAHV